MKIFLICGEKSGENIVEQILDKIDIKNKKIEIEGIFSDEIATKYNVKQFFHSKELAILGIGDIFFNIPKILDKINDTANKIIEFQPDLVITIDAYDFCIRVVKKIRKTKKNIQIWHIVAPSVWAYWSFRAKVLAKYYNRLFYLLPIEYNYFKPLETIKNENNNGFLSTFIGYPATFQSKDLTIKKDEKLIGITIGSRKKEIKRHKDLIISTIMKLKIFDKDLKFAIFTTKETKKYIEKLFYNIKNIEIFSEEKDKQKNIQKCILVIAKNGTNNIEIGSLGTCIITYYKTSILTYTFAKIFAKIKFINLFNIILNKQVVPEFLQKQATSNNLFNEAISFITNEDKRNKQMEEINKAISLMQRKDKKHPLDVVSEEIINIIQ